MSVRSWGGASLHIVAIMIIFPMNLAYMYFAENMETITRPFILARQKIYLKG